MADESTELRETTMNSRTEGYLYLLGFGLSIPLANWMIGNKRFFPAPRKIWVDPPPPKLKGATA